MKYDIAFNMQIELDKDVECGPVDKLAASVKDSAKHNYLCVTTNKHNN